MLTISRELMIVERHLGKADLGDVDLPAVVQLSVGDELVLLDEGDNPYRAVVETVSPGIYDRTYWVRFSDPWAHARSRARSGGKR